MKNTVIQRSPMLALIAASVILMGSTGSGCSDADVASRNLSVAAEQFEINRRVVFYNSISDTYILTIEGRCSVEFLSHYSEVTCRLGDDQYKKHYLRKSDNTTMFVEQTELAKVGVYHYRVIFKPQTILPNVDFEGSIKGG